jgi:hypothetical protein
MNPLSHNEQERMKALLDDHFAPMLRDEWQNSLSIYEIGCKPKDGKLREVIIWVRSADILSHVQGLLVPAVPMMILDPVDRGEEDEHGPDESCRHRGDTVMVRLLKQVESESEGTVDLMVELFQVFGDESDAEDVYEKAKAITGKSSVSN